MRIGAHAAHAAGCQRPQFRHELARVVEQFLRFVTLQPVFQHLQVRRVVMHARQRYLVRTPETLDLLAVDFLRPGPALGCAQHDHRPAGTCRRAACARLLLDGANLRQAAVHGRGHGLVQTLRVIAFDETGVPAITAEQIFQFLVRDARQNGRIVDLVAVQMQDRQYRAVADRVEKLVGVPGGRQRAGFRLAVTDRDRHQQVRIVESRTKRVRYAVTQFTALVDRSRGFRRTVAANAAGERELPEEVLHAFHIFALVRIDL